LCIATRRSPAPADGSPRVEIEVRDSGVGMSEELRTRVFEPFFTTKEVGKGSGLGLSQVYGFVSQSEGEVRIESEPDKGASFILTLPESGRPAQDRSVETDEREPVGGSERVL